MRRSTHGHRERVTRRKTRKRHMHNSNNSNDKQYKKTHSHTQFSLCVSRLNCLKFSTMKKKIYSVNVCVLYDIIALFMYMSPVAKSRSHSISVVENPKKKKKHHKHTHARYTHIKSRVKMSAFKLVCNLYLCAYIRDMAKQFMSLVRASVEFFFCMYARVLFSAYYLYDGLVLSHSNSILTQSDAPHIHNRSHTHAHTHTHIIRFIFPLVLLNCALFLSYFLYVLE